MANKDRTAVESGLSDILGNVIQSDRRRAGRTEEPVAPSQQHDTMTSPPVIQSSDNNAITQYDSNTTQQPIESPEEIIEKVPPVKKRQSKNEPKEEQSLVEQRAEEARRLAATPTTTVTLRIPLGLNDWLDEYVHGSWPEKVKKQQLVTEALQLLFARRGKPKEEVLSTELLPENE